MLKKIIILSMMVVFITGVLMGTGKQKIIFDCDLGGDIDDAYAVALILTSPEFDILGLVMDHGNTPARAKVACRLLYETGREDIPVIVGRHTPREIGKDKELAGISPQFKWAEEFRKISPSSKNAADFIIENLNKYPGEVILFTVGPISNIQDVLKKDPEALKKAKRVVSMFGSYYMGYDGGTTPDAEWNVKADIEAARMLVNSDADLTFAGLDITTNVKLKEDNRNRLLMRQSPLTDALCGLYTLWRFESYSVPDPTLYDVVAVGMVLWPDLFETRATHVKVTEKGFTVIDESKKPNCTIGMKINQEEFINRIMERYIKQNLHR